MPKVQTNQQLQQQMNGHYYLCARNLSTQQRFSLDMDKSEKHIHSGFFLLFSVVRSVVFLKLQTRTTTTAAAKKKSVKNNGSAWFLLRLQHILYMRPLYDNKHIQIM